MRINNVRKPVIKHYIRSVARALPHESARLCLTTVALTVIDYHHAIYVIADIISRHRVTYNHVISLVFSLFFLFRKLCVFFFRTECN